MKTSRVRRWAAVLAMTILGSGALLAPNVVEPQKADAAVAATTLVLYDTTGAYGFLGEQYAMLTANLASQFGTWTAKPVSQYTAGMMNAYTGVIYIGSTYDEPIPTAFLDDVLAGTKPVMWMYSNIWQLTNRQFAKTGQYWANVRGWDWTGYDTSSVGEVTYKGRSVGRYSPDQSGIMGISVNDPTKATVLALAKRADGSTFPWATRSGNLTYLGEVPLSYISENNRYLVLADLLFDLLDPTRPERHRALVRIEDVSPASDPAELVAVADALAAEGVPFSVTVIPEYRDPLGVWNGGAQEITRLNQAPLVVNALKYMQSKGGTIIFHGWTHQFDGILNPYNQVSGDDTEFFRLVVDPATNNVVFTGALTKDAQKDHQSRLNTGKSRFTTAGFTAPTIFTPPHYAASPNAYKAIKASFGARYDRGMYFERQLSGGTPSTTRFVGQFFPYPVNDINGSRIVPENLGNEEPDAFNNNPPRSPADIIASARSNLMVRDGFASFFWHPYLVSDPRVGVGHLTEIVRGIKALGYGFVSSPSIAGAANTYSLVNSSQGLVGSHAAASLPRVSAVLQRAATANPPGAAVAAAATGGTVPVPANALNRKPAAPISRGEQLRRDPDRGPLMTVRT